MATFNTILGNQIKYYLKKYDINQAELARKLNISRGTVSMWVNGKYTPRASQIDRMCKIFHCSRQDLVGSEKSTDVQLMFDELKPWQQEAIIDQMKDYVRRNREYESEEKRRTSIS